MTDETEPPQMRRGLHYNPAVPSQLPWVWARAVAWRRLTAADDCIRRRQQERDETDAPFAATKENQ